ncbi:putative nadh-ubiquinone oxidoreductase subunit [Erysiphe necator]|uniref:Putative nadh-ubiquinone oxidoreductase subunit n=1 Tax=Uncinula necator TaxID=52586 RepID=A0A0B1PDL2_UNCNE|nr:putative nadh-ubiquinone oxidoreductase subunit [Erysiphe necator]
MFELCYTKDYHTESNLIDHNYRIYFNEQPNTLTCNSGPRIMLSCIRRTCALNPRVKSPKRLLIAKQSIASITSSQNKTNAILQDGISKSTSLAAPPLSVTGKVRREVPLPSQEEKKGVMQYALYVLNSREILYRMLTLLWNNT